jgi:myo-inositol catabolism protein IolC
VVGRTIWQEPVTRFLAGELDGGAARAEISDTFAKIISDFRDARPSMGLA